MTSNWPPEKITTAVCLSVLPVFIGMAMSMIWPPGEWFKSLNKPAWNPPTWVYMIVWAILYPLLGISMTMACFGQPNGASWVLPAINIAFSLLFIPIVFGMHSLFAGFLLTFLCLIFGAGILWEYSALQQYVSSGLMVPYIVWMLFASYLAFAFYRLNPTNGYAPKKRVRYSRRSS